MVNRYYFTSVWDWVKRFFNNHVHFIQLHYMFFLIYVFFFSALYYIQPGTNWNYIDALFMATTGCTNTGLNTVAISSLTIYQTMVLFFSSFFGSHVGVSLILVFIRRHYFSKRFEDVLLFNKARRMREEHKRKRTQHKSMTTARPSAPLHLRKLRRSSVPSMFGQESTHPYSNPVNTHSSAIETTTNTNNKHHSLNIYPNTIINNDNNNNNHNHNDGDDDQFILSPLQLVSSSPLNLSSNNSFIQEEETKLSDHEKNGGSTITFTSDEKSINNNNNNNNNNNYDNENNDENNNNNADDSTSDYKNNKNDENNYMSDHNSNNDKINNVDDNINIDMSMNINIDNENNIDDHSGMETTGIAFADNIERQREVARQRLVQDRRFREALARITLQTTPKYDEEEAGIDYNDDDDDGELEKIMREPIDKSQLTREQRYRIGGAEYHALDILVHLVPIYYVGTIVLFGFLFRIYIACSTYAQEVLLTSNPTGPVDPWHFSFFQSLSGFNNLGIALIDASMVPFQNAPVPLILTILLILFGNTAYAINLRFIIWCMYKLTPSSRHMRREALRYLLDHPRRCYTTLFPSTQTYWLLFTLVVITLVELTSFLALNYWLPVLDGISSGARFLDGLFQSVATRNAGFSVVSLMDLNPGTQLVYIVAMYISVYPVAISMRNSNVYQERALGIYRGASEDDDSHQHVPTTGPSLILKLRRHPTMNSVVTTGKKIIRRPDFFVVTQIQRQLSSDITWLIACLFVIVILEAQRIMDPSPITVWTVIYECVSAFGNVGASTGYPNAAVSQSGEYRTLSKLVIILLMYRGRHRGLPSSIDRAVMLPSDQLEEKEAEEQIFRRRNTVVSQTLNSTTSGHNNSGFGFPNTFFYRSTP